MALELKISTVSMHIQIKLIYLRSERCPLVSKWGWMYSNIYCSVSYNLAFGHILIALQPIESNCILALVFNELPSLVINNNGDLSPVCSWNILVLKRSMQILQFFHLQMNNKSMQLRNYALVPALSHIFTRCVITLRSKICCVFLAKNI